MKQAAMATLWFLWWQKDSEEKAIWAKQVHRYTAKSIWRSWQIKENKRKKKEGRRKYRETVSMSGQTWTLQHPKGQWRSRWNGCNLWMTKLWYKWTEETHWNHLTQWLQQVPTAHVRKNNKKIYPLIISVTPSYPLHSTPAQIAKGYYSRNWPD